MFPAHAGMNRASYMRVHYAHLLMFPAHAGMNRQINARRGASEIRLCSPHTRG